MFQSIGLSKYRDQLIWSSEPCYIHILIIFIPEVFIIFQATKSIIEKHLWFFTCFKNDRIMAAINNFLKFIKSNLNYLTRVVPAVG